jgi:hypothetical protein
MSKTDDLNVSIPLKMSRHVLVLGKPWPSPSIIRMAFAMSAWWEHVLHGRAGPALTKCVETQQGTPRADGSMQTRGESFWNVD